MSKANRHIALLRGINVGGKNKLPMATLKTIFEDAGCENVRTYIQSGNVVLEASAAAAKNLADDIARRITKKTKLNVPVVIRNAKQWRAMVKANPFLKKGIDEKSCHVMCLADAPTKAQLATLDSDRSPGDSYLIKGADVFLHTPNGVARTKLTNAYFDSRLNTVSTARNWRTVLTLAAMLDE